MHLLLACWKPQQVMSPKSSEAAQMDMRRRLATREELSAGEDQMRRAQERLAVETVERGEQALEDVQRAAPRQ